eukprot:scaffold295619_cov18-Tisochrysis_lutea.AAC.1
MEPIAIGMAGMCGVFGQWHVCLNVVRMKEAAAAVCGCVASCEFWYGMVHDSCLASCRKELPLVVMGQPM